MERDIEIKKSWLWKETLPKDRIKVGVHVACLGGNGDIATGAKIVDALFSSAQANHFGVRVFTSDGFAPKLETFHEQLHGLPEVLYSRGEFNERILDYAHSPEVAGQKVLIDEDVMVFVHTYADRDLLNEETIVIEISEYSSGKRETDLAKKIVGISTGFCFDPKHESIQAGLMYSRQFERLQEMVRENKNKEIKKCERVLSDKVGLEIELENKRFGFYYVSSLRPNHAYFDIMKEAERHMNEPISIIALVGGGYEDDRDSLEFKEKILALGFNYVADGVKVDQGSNVTVVNPHTLPSEIFQELMILAELPIVVTGDQSLTEAIQKGLGEFASPFLPYTLNMKEADFLDFIKRIDPDVCSIFASYYYHELTQEDKYSILQRDYIAEKLVPHFQNILLKSEIARLFYDKKLIERFNRVAAAIPKQMMEDRKGFVDEPEGLVDATMTVEAVLEAVRMGKMEGVKKMMPRGNIFGYR